MKTPAESEPSHHLETFEHLLRHGKKTLEMLFNNPADYGRIMDDYGIFTIPNNYNLQADYKKRTKCI